MLAAGDAPPPAEPRQFRAAWVATVANIDWPSRPGLGAAEQQAEARAILERARALGLNALVLQIRPAGDALYASRLEPWSEVLSGQQGRPPKPWWDPLAFWVREAHRRGLQLHAWFNPFRARHSSAKSPLARPHIALRSPASVKAYGDLLWMDPGDAAARAHTLAVIEDVLRRYDIDGVHIDDYFYPYPLAAPDGSGDLAFPDSEAYLRYLGEGGALPLPDWRRAFVDSFVAELHRRVRRVRPQVLVGISPFGLGRPERRAAGIAGFSQYDKLYADVERWLAEGWLDYLAPQLYWPVDSAGQPFVPLLRHWAEANVQRRHLWPGLYTSAPWPAREVLQQVALLQGTSATSEGGSAAAGGHIHFSMAALMQDRDGIATQLQRGPYASAALVPPTPWLGEQAPPPPRLMRLGWPGRPGRPGRLPQGDDAVLVEAGGGRGEAAAASLSAWAVWRRIEGRWQFAVVPATERRIARERADAVVVSAVDRLGNTSARMALRW
ncbi:MAG: family 10 glycosylhydrolase [Rubrivivax sp.]|nr:family 10 glycosylhydrolase [Rubrivivax sp.]